jgi:hypothetical protein
MKMQHDKNRSIWYETYVFSGAITANCDELQSKFIAARNVTYFHKMNRIVTPDQPRCSVDNVAKRFEAITG